MFNCGILLVKIMFKCGMFSQLLTNRRIEQQCIITINILHGRSKRLDGSYFVPWNHFFTEPTSTCTFKSPRVKDSHKLCYPCKKLPMQDNTASGFCVIYSDFSSLNSHSFTITATCKVKDVTCCLYIYCWPTCFRLAMTCSLHAVKFQNQGRRSKSGRPGDCRTNVLTEVASPTLCFQTRNPRIVCIQIHVRTNERHSPDVKESCQDLGTSRF